MSGELQQYIVENSTPLPETGCWLWEKAWTAKGYGGTGMGGQHYAHRLAYQEFVGSIPAGMLVCHSCDVRPCCNPAHLFIGTIDDNQKDSARKGRMHCGTSNYNHKLTAEAVREIRASDKTSTALARQFGVCVATLCMARRGETWRNV